MGETHVVSALRDKRAEISGAIVGLEKELGRRRTDLMHLDATLRLFAPALAPQSIKPRKQTGRNSWFRKGERSRLVLALLRTADRPLATREITGRLAAAKGIDPSDALARDAGPERRHRRRDSEDEKFAHGGYAAAANAIRSFSDIATARARIVGAAQASRISPFNSNRKHSHYPKHLVNGGDNTLLCRRCRYKKAKNLWMHQVPESSMLVPVHD